MDILDINKVLLLGDCVERMRDLGENTVDSVVTDPPYGIEFMSKGWDKGVPRVEVWEQVFRVLKPGGHLLCFAGTRTQHRMCCNVEDAGFEIRDMLAWVYGSGFPKSLNISKAIDKSETDGRRIDRAYRFTEWFVKACTLTKKEINSVTSTSDMARHWTDAKPNGKQPDIPTRDKFELLRPHICGGVPEWVEYSVDERSRGMENFKNREVIGSRPVPKTVYKNIGVGATHNINHDYTKPRLSQAEQWDGWGTALKPALEPITLARKPFNSTVAENVLTHGTGGLNIDACQAPGDRFPANFIHDGCDPVGESSRFFYCAKASKADREEGLENLPTKSSADITGRKEGSAGLNNPRASVTAKTDRANIHPTVKPTDLMRYLCRLVTPPGGWVLDPFMGSGSTGKAALLEGFNFAGCELDPEYFNIAAHRIG